GAGTWEDATDRPEVTAATFGVVLDEPGRGRREQRQVPVQPLTLHGPRTGTGNLRNAGGACKAREAPEILRWIHEAGSPAWRELRPIAGNSGSPRFGENLTGRRAW